MMKADDQRLAARAGQAVARPEEGYASVISRLRARINDLGVTQKKLAVLLGWDPSLLSRYLKDGGAVRMSAARLDRLLDRLGYERGGNDYGILFADAGLQPPRRPDPANIGGKQPRLAPLGGSSDELVKSFRGYLKRGRLQFFIQGGTEQPNTFLLPYHEAMVTVNFPPVGHPSVRAFIKMPHMVPADPELRARVLEMLAAFSYFRVPCASADPTDGEIRVETGSLVSPPDRAPGSGDDPADKIFETVIYMSLTAFVELRFALDEIMKGSKSATVDILDHAEKERKRCETVAKPAPGVE